MKKLMSELFIEVIFNSRKNEVCLEIKKAMKNTKDRGRIILVTIHTIAVGTNYDSFMAMVDE